MKTSNKLDSSLITLKDDEWLNRQLFAGKVVFSILRECENYLINNNVSLKDLENIAVEILNKNNCSATFLNYKGFPSAICASVNKQLVHGVVTDYVLQPGDLISVDLGATFEGAIADSAYTWIYKEPKNKLHVELVKAGKRALEEGIKAVKIGNKLGAIGKSISKYVGTTGFGLVTNYGGHGIDYDSPHAAPFVSNKADSSDGIEIVNGLSIAIEPMLVIGVPTTFPPSKDNWTVMTKDIGCHFEHSVTVMHDKVYVITGEN